MNGKEMSSALREGKRVYGTLIVSNSPRWPMEVKQTGLDFVFIDTEHIALDRDKLSWMCQTYRALNLVPIVRIPSPDPYQATMALDGGAGGIIAPYVETVEQVKALRGAVKLRPLKGEKLQNILDGKEVPEEELDRYMTERNEENVLIVNIESKPAMEALDDILKVPQLDGVLIGPHDLSCNLGIPEQYQNPDFDKAVRTIIKKARANNVGAGIHYWASIDQEIDWIREGANLIVHSADITAFAKGISNDIKKIKGALNDKNILNGENNINI